MSEPNSRVAELLHQLRRTESGQREEIVGELLPLMHSDAPTQVLLDALDVDEARLHVSALVLLGMRKDRSVVRAIARHCRAEASPNCRLYCVGSLSPSDGREAVDALIAGLGDADPRVRACACTGFFMNDCRRAHRAIRGLLDDPDWNVRLIACRTMVSHRIRDRRLVDTVERLRTEPGLADYAARVTGTQHLGQGLLSDPDALSEHAGRPVSQTSTLAGQIRGGLALYGDQTPERRLDSLAEQARCLMRVK